jgi:hypothetical protein
MGRSSDISPFRRIALQPGILPLRSANLLLLIFLEREGR